MTHVEFYVLPQDDAHHRLVFACRLAEKAFRQGTQIYLHTDNEAQSQQLEQLLWSFRPSSFLPLQQDSDSNEGDNHGVVYGHSEPPAQCRQLLINLSSTVPEFFSRFERLAEIVVRDNTITANSRINFRFYKDRGYPLKTHDIPQ